MAARGTATATILFTDVVDSTALRARLGEQAADRLFVEHQRQLGQLVSHHGGRVVKSGGDGVMASFGSASEAVNAAVALQEHVSRATPALAVRVGVAAGDVAWEDDDCFGLPVVTAARLQATAEGGEILVSHIVRLLAGDRAGDRYEHVGTVDLKGLPEAVDVYTVGWTRPDLLDEGAEPGPPPALPLALTVTATHPLVGRDDAVAAIRHAWADSRQGPGRVVLVGGEAGAGKTRLAAEIAGELHGTGACVLYGGCDFDLALPYQPWVHAGDQLLPALPRSTLDADFIVSVAPLASLLSRADWLATDPRRISLDAGAERYRAYGAFAALLAEASGRWPTVVVLDDLHWAGMQTLALLRHLARAGLPKGLLLVGTFRDTGDEVTEPLASVLADLRRVEGVTRLRLAGLDTPAVERFVADAVSQPLDDDLRHLAARLAERSGGNAFYLGELWRHLVDTGTVVRDGVRWAVREDTSAHAVPDSVREVVSDRLAHLSPPARRIAELASLSGQRIDLQVLEAASDLSPDDLDGAVAELVAAGLLFEVPGAALVYRFAHALVRETVESTISPPARARLHLAMAEAIESVHGADRRPVLAELAGHFALAGRPLDKIVYYARRAAAQAMRAAAYDEAIGHLQIMLERTPPSVERSAALVELAKAQIRQGSFEDSRNACLEAFRIATDLGDAIAAADAAVGFENSMHVPGWPGGPGVDMLRAALTMLGDDDVAKRAEVMASLGRALVFSGRGAEGNEMSDAAVALAREVGDPAILAVALQTLVSSLDDPIREIDIGVELGDIAERIGDPWAASYATANMIRAYVELGRIDEAIEVQERHRTISAAGHFATFEFMTHAYDAVLALAAADFPAAESAAERALAKGAADLAPYDEGVYGLQMYAIRRAQGRLREVEPALRMLAASGQEMAPMWLPGLAALYTDLQMLAEAGEVFERMAADDFSSVTRDAVWPASLTFLAETCLALGDRERATLLAAELESCAGRNLMAGMTICFGPADRLRGGLSMLLGRPDDADEQFGAALALAEQFRSPLWTAEVQSDWARALVDRDPHRARVLAKQALMTAREHGIGRISNRPMPEPSGRATHAMSGNGVRPRTSGALPDNLSEREAEVLRLVAIGRSNREIGERLFISQNTVANHVRAILRKTRCSNRTEATLYAVRNGILTE